MKLEFRSVRTFPDMTLPVIPLRYPALKKNYENQISPVPARSVQSIAPIQSLPPG
jgi:hypothetical protein